MVNPRMKPEVAQVQCKLIFFSSWVNSPDFLELIVQQNKPAVFHCYATLPDVSTLNLATPAGKVASCFIYVAVLIALLQDDMTADFCFANYLQNTADSDIFLLDRDI